MVTFFAEHITFIGFPMVGFLCDTNITVSLYKHLKYLPAKELLLERLTYMQFS